MSEFQDAIEGLKTYGFIVCPSTDDDFKMVVLQY